MSRRSDAGTLAGGWLDGSSWLVEQPESVDETRAENPSAKAVPLNDYGRPSKLATRTIERHTLVRSTIEQGHSMARIAREQASTRAPSSASPPPNTPTNLPGRALGRSRLLDDYKPYLLRRIAEGCTHANTLHAVLQASGWRGGIRTVCRFVFPLRDAKQLPPPPPPRVPETARCLELDALAGHVIWKNSSRQYARRPPAATRSRC